MYKVIVDKNSDGQRVDKFIKKILPLAPANFIYKMFRNKDVKINGVRVKENQMVYVGDEVELFLYEDKVKEFSQEVKVETLQTHFKVVYEDDNILVVSKPAGLILHEDDKEKKQTLANEVLSYLFNKGEYNPNDSQGFVPGPCHRLDRNTSGLVIFGKTFAALKDLNEMIRLRHCIEKRYMTIVCGELTKGDHLIGYMKKDEKDNHCYMVSKDTKDALTMETEYEVLKHQKNYSLLEVHLITGRTHQIRLHMSSIHHPVIGDRKYGNFEVNKELKKKYNLNNQWLHAYKITFVKPIGSLKYLEGKTIQCLPEGLFETIRHDLFD